MGDDMITTTVPELAPLWSPRVRRPGNPRDLYSRRDPVRRLVTALEVVGDGTLAGLWKADWQVTRGPARRPVLAYRRWVAGRWYLDGITPAGVFADIRRMTAAPDPAPDADRSEWVFGLRLWTGWPSGYNGRTKHTAEEILRIVSRQHHFANSLHWRDWSGQFLGSVAATVAPDVCPPDDWAVDAAAGAYADEIEADRPDPTGFAALLRASIGK